MKLNEIKETPVIPTRQGLEVKEVNAETLKEKGLGLVTYGLEEGDTFEFPDSMADVKLFTRQIRKDSTAVEQLILGLKNGQPGYLSMANLRRRDHKAKPVHPLAEALNRCENDFVRLEMCLGKTIVAKGTVTYEEAVFDNGTRLDQTKSRTVSSLQFL